jgi:hypothetical protein
MNSVQLRKNFWSSPEVVEISQRMLFCVTPDRADLFYALYLNFPQMEGATG